MPPRRRPAPAWPRARLQIEAEVLTTDDQRALRLTSPTTPAGIAPRTCRSCSERATRPSRRPPIRAWACIGAPTRWARWAASISAHSDGLGRGTRFEVAGTAASGQRPNRKSAPPEKDTHRRPGRLGLLKLPRAPRARPTTLSFRGAGSGSAAHACAAAWPIRGGDRTRVAGRSRTRLRGSAARRRDSVRDAADIRSVAWIRQDFFPVPVEKASDRWL